MNNLRPASQKASFARLLASPLLYLSVGVASLATGLGCSSSSSPASTSPASCTAGTTVSCTCANGDEGTETCGSNSCECAGAGSSDAGSSAEDAGSPSDSGAKPEDSGSGEGAGNHDGAAPSSLYGACAVKGGFGWSCTVSNALDPTNCTDPNFPFCFGGGQGFWCTRACTTANFETACNLEDAGCTSSACNAKGYCK